MLELSSFNNKKNTKNFLALNPTNLFPDRKESKKKNLLISEQLMDIINNSEMMSVKN